MAVTATAALVKTFSGDPPRPPGHAGWNNPSGDIDWIPDIDFYRRVRLACSGNAGEDTRTVNWECYDGTVPFKTNAELASTTAGTTASPFGALVNNSDTWTIWATTGVATAGQAKYYDTKQMPVSTLRANGQTVQVLLGPAKKIGADAVTWNIAAFLPGSGRTPSAKTTVTVTPPARATGVSVLPTTRTQVQGGLTASVAATVAPANALNKTVVWSSSNKAVVTVDPASGVTTTVGAGTANVTATTVDGGFTASCAYTVTASELLAVPTSSSSKQEILDWLAENGAVVADPAIQNLSKKELLALVQDILDDDSEA
jgi:hypothetical protein